MTIEELEVLAKDATHGERNANGLNAISIDYTANPDARFTIYRATRNDAAFITACTPEAILAIAARMRELESALKPLIERYEKRKTLFGEYPNDAGEIMVNCKDLRRARAALQQEK